MTSEQQPDLVPVFASLGLRPDAPRAVVKAIVKAAQTVETTDAAAIERVLSAFNLVSLLKPGATVATLAAGIADLARSDQWTQIAVTSE